MPVQSKSMDCFCMIGTSVMKELELSGDVSIHRRCVNSLLTEVCKYINGLSPEIMNEVFSTRTNF